MRCGAVRSDAVRDRLCRCEKRGPCCVSSPRMYGEGRIFSQKKALVELGVSARSLAPGALGAKAKRYRTSTARTLGLAGGSSGSCEETRAMKAAVIGGPAVNKGEQLWEV